VPVSRRLPLLLAFGALAVALILVPGRASGATVAALDLWAGPTSAQVTGTTASVSATAVPVGSLTDWYFQYGPATSDYGSTTRKLPLLGEGLVPVSAELTGLQPGTAYRVRLVVKVPGKKIDGPATTFVTDPAPEVVTSPVVDEAPQTTTPDAALAPAMPAPAATSETPGTPATPAPSESTSGEQPADAAAAPLPAPTQGKAVVAAETAGAVRVKTPGGDGFRSLADAASVPVGSVVDARDGTIALSSETASGTQTGEFRGAIFEVRQSRAGGGMADLVLKGGSFASCGRTAKTVAHAAGKRRRAVRALWGKDRGGRFRTRGRDSVATVRGTEWKVVDRCDGTLTTVSEGAVSVRDLRTGRRTLVRAGGRHFSPHR
jgi:hypothetical protein